MTPLPGHTAEVTAKGHDRIVSDAPEPAPAPEVVLTADAHAPGVARGFLAEHGVGLPPAVLNDAELLISELITNAVRYGEPAITLTVRTDPPGLGVAVHDRGDTIPGPASEQPASEQPSGRGLLIVAAVADTWGVEVSDPPPGKTVWFTLGRTDGP